MKNSTTATKFSAGDMIITKRGAAKVLLVNGLTEDGRFYSVDNGNGGCNMIAVIEKTDRDFKLCN